MNYEDAMQLTGTDLLWMLWPIWLIAAALAVGCLFKHSNHK